MTITFYSPCTWYCISQHLSSFRYFSSIVMLSRVIEWPQITTSMWDNYLYSNCLIFNHILVVSSQKVNEKKHQDILRKGNISWINCSILLMVQRESNINNPCVLIMCQKMFAVLCISPISLRFTGCYYHILFQIW